MSEGNQANKIIRAHVLWSLGAGLIPVPILDIAAVSAIQVDMLMKLAGQFGIDYSKTTGRTFVTALAGGTLARVGASAVKIIPGIGTIIGGLSMSALSGASTYAVGQVAMAQFASGGDLSDVDMDSAKQEFSDAFKRGKQFVSGLKGQKKESKDLYRALKKLEDRKKKGDLTEEEFEAEKHKLLDSV